jgi:integrase
MLRKEDVHLDERYIELRGTKTDAADRIVPIHKKIAPLLEKRLAGDNEWLFPSTRGNPISYTPFRIKFDEIMKELNLYPHKPHECRHTFSTFAKSSGLDKYYVKSIIGHKNQDLTDDVYTHTLLEDLVEQIDMFEI